MHSNKIWLDCLYLQNKYCDKKLLKYLSPFSKIIDCYVNFPVNITYKLIIL